MSRQLGEDGVSRVIDLLAVVPHLAAGGVGDMCSPCSIAAINLAVTGRLTDRVPSFMSRPMARWVRGVQDSSPAAMRDSAGWRDLLPAAAGAGRQHERQHRVMVFNAMWRSYSVLADRATGNGFGDQWLGALHAQGRDDSLTVAADAADAAGDTAAGRVARTVRAALSFDSCEMAGAATGMVFTVIPADGSDLDPVTILASLLASGRP